MTSPGSVSARINAAIAACAPGQTTTCPRIQMSKHRFEPFGASLTVGVASPAQVVSHQQFIICPHQYLRQTLFQHVVEVHAIRRWRGIHAQVEDRGQFDFRRRDISASSAAALQQVAASGFVVCARDRRQVDVQLCCQLALRRQAVTRFQRSVYHRRLQRIRNLQKTWPAVPGQSRQPDGKSGSCMVFNWDILSQCMEIAFK
jgi:hypothetical protein